MVYEKHEYYVNKKTYNYAINTIFGKSEIIQHVLKIQFISLLPKYIKRISACVLLCVFAYTNAGV